MLAPTEVKALSRIVPWRVGVTIAGDWLIVALLFVVAAKFPHPLVYLACALLMARQQLALAVIMHDAAHKRLARRPGLNDLVAQFLVAGPIFFSLHSYRSTHLVHHKTPLGPDDPDLRLTGGFPISRASLRRKLLRDLFGISYFKFFGHFIRASKKIGAQKREQHEPKVSSSMVILSVVLGNVAILLALWCCGHPLLWLLWIVPPMTILQVYLRVRGIAEHAGYAPNPDQALATRTVVNPVQAFFCAPHNVNFHIEHHLYPSVPFYNLQIVHQLLLTRGALPPQNVYTSYLTMLRDVTRPPEPT